MSNGQLIISIVAGTRLDTISDGLGFDHSVRLATKSNNATIIPVSRPSTVERINHFFM
jgi:pyrroline-5-carboxylate reductase